MMHIDGKWLVRGGALLILLGFFMPSALVSCAALPGASQGYSLSQLSNQSVGGEPILYLVLLGAVAALIFAFFTSVHSKQVNLYLLAQVLGTGLGVLSIIGTFLSLSGQMRQIGLDVKPDYGFFFLLVGYGASAVGIVMQFQENARAGIPFSLRDEIPGTSLIEPPPIQPQVATTARLEVMHGTPGISPIPVFDGFLIGRSSKANLPIPDPSVSSQHARLRYAGGNWYLQDQSSNGTFVNGKKVEATLLASGDQIKIGEKTFVFRA
jgi:hypothetical protein